MLEVARQTHPRRPPAGFAGVSPQNLRGRANLAARAGATLPAVSDSFVPPTEFEEYRIIRSLGRGGMGHVFLAHDTLLDRPVAVKFIATASPDARLRQQFFTEARAIARLSHPNVVAVYRVGEVRRQPYLVSEFVRGETLDKIERPLPARRLLGIAVGLASGLAAAHRRGVLHRDIKPANAILTEEGEAKLLDFGLAKLFEPDGAPSAPSPADGGRPQLVGTPGYIAPEIWRGEPPTAATDVYGFGVMLFELLVGRSPAAERGTADLAHVPPALAAVVERCLADEPARRYPTAAGLREALEPLATAVAEGSREIPEGNPYPGLTSFEAAHRALFFGRGADVRAVVDRLRAEAFVLVTGDSGVGKSSLCRAGVIPALGDGWQIARLVPGRRPLLALAAAIAHAAGRDEPEVEAELRGDPSGLAARLARAGPLLIFVDQLEELVTLADPAEAELFAEAWAMLAVARPGLRLLATVRGDFLTRLGNLQSLRDLVGPALYILGPLDAGGVRSAIVDPAGCKGVRFESEALIDELAGSVARGAGGLPLLQFALAALWESRDQARGVIPAAALEKLGGVDGALAHHADGVIARLRPTERAAVRPLLTRLVTADGTRARYPRDELIRPAGSGGQAALEALVRNRLVVARESEDGRTGTYEIAHEALITGWETLRGWLAENAEARAAQERLARAAAEWARLRRPSDLLLTFRQLQELDRIPGLALGAAQSEFVTASRKVRRRQRRNFWLLTGAGTVAIALSMLGISVRARRAQNAAVDHRVAQAEEALSRSRRSSADLQATRTRAFRRFDQGDTKAGEILWRQAGDLSRQRDAAWTRAGIALEGALALDPGRADVRERMADLLLDRALAAGHDDPEHEGLIDRLSAYDDGGSRVRRLLAPARVGVSSRPPGALVTLARFASRDGRLALGPPRALGPSPTEVAVEPGSYLFAFELPGHPSVRLPLLLERAQRRDVTIDLPAAHDVPAGYVYVPAGPFLYGSAEGEELRRVFNAQPLHEVQTGAYLIARNEVTFAEWISFLNDLPPHERERRRPRATNRSHRLELIFRRGQWILEFAPTDHLYRALAGEKLRYLDRDRRALQDWLRFPVAAVSCDDALAFTAWLDRTGRLPGARLCTEHEWERAARGADGRRFPWGERVGPDDMNYDRTYGMQLLAFGPDEVGSYPGARSPFGVEDMAGNVFEWSCSATGELAINRGGSWRQDEIVSRSANGEPSDAKLRLPDAGFRVCATVQPRVATSTSR